MAAASSSAACYLCYHPDDGLFDALSVTTSETSLDRDCDPSSDTDDEFVGEREPMDHSSSYYHHLISQYAEEGPIMANRGDIANKMIRTEEGKWIDGFLSSSLRNTALGSSSKNKSRLYVGDLDLILHHHWVLDEERFAHERLHVQMAVILILAGATATRPGALIGNLSYKKVEFQVFPPASGSKRARVGMIVTLTKTKRTAGKSRPNKFGFHEENTLLRDPVLYMESLVFADGAFAS
ncbi:hypothetical protein Sste5346_008641 [Sporothrix stenoceras]|uniref:Uncharacterized protein n=1 Tax=Sporothrix stenoceras TaxID=5173 RepID=A0ABR3YNH7_9PEZI